MKAGAPRSKKELKARISWWWRRFLRSILIINDTPHRVALGVAIGTFITYLPMVGIQMMLSAGLALLTRANVAATVPPVWITNPITIIPIYLFLHWLGNLFVGGPALRWSQLYEALAAIAAKRSEEGLWASMRFAANDFFYTILWPMTIGGFIVGAINGAIFYWLTYRAISAYQHRKMLRRLEWIKHSKPELISNVQSLEDSPL
ncbi:MAG: DUF2062 domain-containing protein [Planctomycetota bacterium]|nr:MAG: DUF2062 domain-containing protein [Planctomycetota bacterium]